MKSFWYLSRTEPHVLVLSQIYCPCGVHWASNIFSSKTRGQYARVDVLAEAHLDSYMKVFICSFQWLQIDNLILTSSPNWHLERGWETAWEIEMESYLLLLGEMEWVIKTNRELIEEPPQWAYTFRILWILGVLKCDMDMMFRPKVTGQSKNSCHEICTCKISRQRCTKLSSRDCQRQCKSRESGRRTWWRALRSKTCSSVKEYWRPSLSMNEMPSKPHAPSLDEVPTDEVSVEGDWHSGV